MRFKMHPAFFRQSTVKKLGIAAVEVWCHAMTPAGTQYALLTRCTTHLLGTLLLYLLSHHLDFSRLLLPFSAFDFREIALA